MLTGYRQCYTKLILMSETVTAFSDCCNYMTQIGKKKVSPDKMVEMQAKIDEERKALETKLDMEEEERNKARAELERREKDLLKAQ